MTALAAWWVGCGPVVWEGDEPGECEDAVDNDGDASVDCDDPQCARAPACAPDRVPGTTGTGGIPATTTPVCDPELPGEWIGVEVLPADVTVASVPAPAHATGAAALGDTDGDGRRELAISDDGNSPSGSQTRLYELGGAGLLQLTQVPRTVLPGYAWALAVGDLSGDGRSDLIVVADEAWVVPLPVVPEVRRLEDAASASYTWVYRGARVVDIDGDGFMDLESWGRVVRGPLVGRRTRDDAEWDAPMAVLPDLDGDGRPEVVTATGSVLQRYASEPGSRHQPLAKVVPSCASDVGEALLVAGDLTGDGDPDLVSFGSWWPSAAVCVVPRARLLAGGALGSSVPRIVEGTDREIEGVVVPGDLDGDGVDELVVNTDDGLGVFFGPLAPGAHAVGEAQLHVTGPGVALDGQIGDVDGDGVPDVVYVYGSAVRVLSGAALASVPR